VLSNLGVNSFRKGEVAVTIGTSGAIRTIIDEPKTDEKGRIFCYVLTEDHYCIGGPVNNGGVVLKWLRDEVLASEVETAKRLRVDSKLKSFHISSSANASFPLINLYFILSKTLLTCGVVF